MDDDGPPRRLPRDSRGLRVLQRLRDEAHRFALAYHRLLRARRIQESRLDEIPGVGKAIRRRLLERFGSVHRLARSDRATIAAVPGVGERLADAIMARVADLANPARTSDSHSDHRPSRPCVAGEGDGRETLASSSHLPFLPHKAAGDGSHNENRWARTAQ